MHRAISYAFGAFASACGYALQWSIVVSQLLTAPMRQVIHCICISDKYSIWVSMQLFLMLCKPIFIINFNKQCHQQVIAPCHFLVPKLRPKTCKKSKNTTAPIYPAPWWFRIPSLAFVDGFLHFSHFFYIASHFVAFLHTLAHFGNNAMFDH